MQLPNQKKTAILLLVPALLLVASITACAAVQAVSSNPPAVEHVETIRIQEDNQKIHEYTICLPDYLGWGLVGTDTDLAGNLVVTYPTTTIIVSLDENTKSIQPSGYKIREFHRPNLMSSKDYIKIEKCE